MSPGSAFDGKMKGRTPSRSLSVCRGRTDTLHEAEYIISDVLKEGNVL